GDEQYDVVTCLNLLDRYDTGPSSRISASCRRTQGPCCGSRPPFSPYVEIGTIDNMPSEELGVTGTAIEEQVNSLATDVFPSLGYKLERWSRLPYLCEGDLDQAFYWLSDVVMVFSKVNDWSEVNEKTISAKQTTEESEDHYDDALDHVV
ncbi:protein-L-histidine N-pros-methyltransferase-like, partial [Homarus americanus]|uniref:protein-L-histidine N-pros-methyltransferase-like n=1 Tax=Homarus americanus TaxID=6706 RepID=UPI001C493E50